MLTFDVGAPSSTEAVQRAAALTKSLLAYRIQYARTQQQQLFTQLDRQYNEARQRLAALETQLSQIPFPQDTTAQKTEYNNLQTQIGPAAADHPVHDRH